MSKPEIHTFGIAKYVYASAYDQLEAEVERVRDELAGNIEGVAKLRATALSYGNGANARGYRWKRDALIGAVAKLDALLTEHGAEGMTCPPLGDKERDGYIDECLAAEGVEAREAREGEGG